MMHINNYGELKITLIYFTFIAHKLFRFFQIKLIKQSMENDPY